MTPLEGNCEMTNCSVPGIGATQLVSGSTRLWPWRMVMLRASGESSTGGACTNCTNSRAMLEELADPSLALYENWSQEVSLSRHENPSAGTNHTRPSGSVSTVLSAMGAPEVGTLMSEIW